MASSLTTDARVKHGLIHSHHDEYTSWGAMRHRCTNPKNPRYAYYGARGIGVCARWDDFGAFVGDMGRRPPGATLDRIDPNRGYEPGNCRWATAREQANNRRNNRMIEYGGRRQSLTQWAREIGISYGTLRKRVVDLKWSLDRALTNG